MHILVTGGAGFIGSRLCERLIDAGEDVICLDAFFTGSRDNIAHLLDSSRFELLRHDVVEPIWLEVDQIYHLACSAASWYHWLNPVQTVETNVAGTLSTLRLAHRSGARILQASGSEVYGEPTVEPQVETYRGNVNPVGPSACYDEGKRVAETLMMDYHRHQSVDIRIARIFDTYGPRMDSGNGDVISNFIIQALRGEPLTVCGTGDQPLCFCYVDDLVDGLIRLMNAQDVHEPINLGSPEECPIGEIARQIAQLCGTSTGIRRSPLTQDNPVHRRPDITRAQLVLDWTPQVGLREGLKRTIEHFESRLTSLYSSRVDALNGWLENGRGTASRTKADLAQPFFDRVELALPGYEGIADFEGLWVR